MCDSASLDVLAEGASPIEPVALVELAAGGAVEPDDGIEPVGVAAEPAAALEPVGLEAAADPPADEWNAFRWVRNSSSFARIAGSTVTDPLVPTAPCVLLDVDDEPAPLLNSVLSVALTCSYDAR